MMYYRSYWTHQMFIKSHNEDNRPRQTCALSQWHTKWGHVSVRPHLAFHYTRGHTLEFDLAVWIFKLQVHINLTETCIVSVIVLVVINVKYDLGINGTRVTFVSFGRIRLLSLKKNKQTSVCNCLFHDNGT